MAKNGIQAGPEETALMAFDDALQAGRSTADALRTAIRLHPDCAALLSDYAMTRVASTPPDAHGLEQRVLGRADALLASRLAEPESPRQISSLLAAIKAAGADASSVAKSAGIGRSVLAKLDRRLLDIATIPQRLVDKLATSIAASSGDIWRYLSKPPTLSRAVSYRAAKAPEMSSGAGSESFSQALATAVDANDVPAADADIWRNPGPLGPPPG